MAKTPTCSCGADEPMRIIFPCAGQANTGQLSNLAALQLTKEGFGNIACITLLATGTDSLVKNARSADEVIIIDGCPVGCVRKILDDNLIPVDQYVIILDLGIRKTHDLAIDESILKIVVEETKRGDDRA